MLRAIENRALKSIFGPKRKDLTGLGEVAQ